MIPFFFQNIARNNETLNLIRAFKDAIDACVAVKSFYRQFREYPMPP